MSEEKIGMYSTEEIYEELATGFLHHSMVDAMYFKIKDLQQKVEQLEKENISLKEANNYHQEVIKSMKEPENAHHYHLENIKLRAINNQLENIIKEAIEYVLKNKLYRFKYDDEELFEITTDKKAKDDLLNILNKGG